MWLNNIQIVLPDGIMPNGSLRIEDGCIAEIREERPNGKIPDLIVMPGIIDVHGDMLERDIEPRPGAMFPVELATYELDKRLASTGITTAYAAVGFAFSSNDLRTQDKATQIITTLNQLREKLLVDVRIHARFEISVTDTVAILEPLLAQNQVHLVSIMDHTPGQGQYKNIPKYVDFMTRWLGFSPEKIGTDIMDRLTHAVEEKTVVARDWTLTKQLVGLALAKGIPVASHDDDTVQKVQEVLAMGVTMSEFPVSIEAAQEARRHGMHVIMGAPNAYRGTSTSDNLSAREAVKLGLVDILASDYFPPAMLHSALLMSDLGVLPLHESLKLISQYPAEAMGLHDRGRIEVGRNADLVVVESGAHHRVRATYRRGVAIFRDSHKVNLG
jgi:alpha-D-ribose 1-methylphosphonate 5-triphosphate diphosphatase